jgi:hypothetical protein
MYKKDNVWTELTKSDIKNLTDAERASIRMKSSDLKFYRSENGKIKGMEVYITWPFKEITPEELGLKLENGIYKVPEGGIPGIDENLFKALGFRIPTQGMNSIESMVIKGFTPKANGDMIVVPSEIVGKAGSDFDIDKLNLYLANYTIKLAGKDYSGTEFRNFMKEDMISRGAKEEYVDAIFKLITPKQFEQINESTYTQSGKLRKGAKTSLSDLTDSKETIEDLAFVKQSISNYNTQFKGKKEIKYVQPTLGTKVSLQNKLINIMSELVLHPDNYEQLVTPNSTATLKKLATDIKDMKVKAGTKQLEDEKSPTYLRTFIGSNSIRERYLTAKRMVGIAALHSTFHVMSQVAGLKLNNKFKAKSLYFMNGAGVESLPINIKLSHHGQDEQGLFPIGFRLDTAGQYISDLISEALSGFVDGAKDPFVFDLNFSLNTANTWFYLQHMGVPVAEVAYFFNQPVLDNLFKEMAKNRAAFKMINGENLTRKELFYKVIAPYYNDITGSNLEAMLAGAEQGSRMQQLQLEKIILSELNEIRSEFDTFSKSGLQKAIREGSNADPRLQIAVLMDYFEYEAQARQMQNFIQAIGYDTNKTKTVQENMLQVGRWERAENEGFINNPQAILDSTFLGEMKAQKEDVFNMFRNFFITLNPELQEVFQPMYDKIDNPEFFMTKDDAISMINRYQNHIITYLLHTTPFQDETGKTVVLNQLYKDMFTGDKTMAATLQRLKSSVDPNISENLVIKELLPLLTDDSTKTDNIMLFRNRMDTFQINNVIEALNNLKNYGEQVADDNLVKFVNDLAKFSILQSGLQTGYLDFKKVLSTEIYSELVKTILDTFKDNPEVDTDKIWDSFHQNNWSNRSIVPKAPAWLRIKDGALLVNPNSGTAINDFLVKYVRDPKLSRADLKKMKKDKTIMQAYKPILFKKTEMTDKKGNIKYMPLSKLGNKNKMTEIYTDDTESILPGNSSQLETSSYVTAAEGWVKATDLLPELKTGTETKVEEETKTLLPKGNRNAALKDLAMKAIKELDQKVEDELNNKEDESKPCNNPE